MFPLDVQAFVNSHGIRAPRGVTGRKAIDLTYENLCPNSLAGRYSGDMQAAITGMAIDDLQDSDIVTELVKEHFGMKSADFGLELQTKITQAAAHQWGDELIEKAWALAIENYKAEAA